MAAIKRFEDLECWKTSRILVRKVYHITSKGSLEKEYDLRYQLRKTSLSCMNNIAEGFSRFSQKEFIRFLDIAIGSAGELKSMLYVLEDLTDVDELELKELHKLTDETKVLTLGLLRYLINKTGIKRMN